MFLLSNILSRDHVNLLKLVWFRSSAKKCQGGNKPTWCTFVVLNLDLNSENVFFFVCVLQQVKIQIFCNI